MGRANGEGSIYQRKDKRWAGAAYVLTPVGTRERKTVYGKSRAEVFEKLAKLQANSRNGIAVAPGQLTFGKYLDGWLEEVIGPRLRRSTAQTYAMYVDRHIRPILGAKRLSQLSANDVRSFVAAKTASGLSAATVKQMHAIIRSALQNALREDLVHRNVAKLVVVRGPDSHEVEPFSPEEARKLLATARGTNLEAFWTVAVAVGLRRGEALGLRWRDIDLERGSLRVAQTLQRVDGKLQILPPKTERSKRRVSLPKVSMSQLSAHLVREKQKFASLGVRWSPDELVFTSRAGTPLEPRNVNRAFYSLLSKAGLRRIRLHDLRHTCASLLLAQGVAPRVVMDLLGHSAIAVTMNTYSHVMPALQQEAASRIDEVLE